MLLFILLLYSTQSSIITTKVVLVYNIMLYYTTAGDLETRDFVSMNAWTEGRMCCEYTGFLVSAKTYVVGAP